MKVVARIPVGIDELKAIRRCARVLSSCGNRMKLITEILHDSVSDGDLSELLQEVTTALNHASLCESRLCELKTIIKIQNSESCL